MEPNEIIKSLEEIAGQHPPDNTVSATYKTFYNQKIFASALSELLRSKSKEAESESGKFWTEKDEAEMNGLRENKLDPRYLFTQDQSDRLNELAYRKWNMQPISERKEVVSDEEIKEAAEQYGGSNYIKNHLPGTWRDRYHGFMAGVNFVLHPETRDKLQSK